ncbi:MAG: Rrf2 family transcriptional regulator [Clostridia bacterium]|nr:Rrf2 family transcriptional regulator [Clostridia bacterium]
MKISTKGRYGLRAMLDLALYSSGSHVSLFNIADRQRISVNYLEQVFSLLRKAGLVRSVKGAQGGYTLADKPSAIRVGTILRILEGDLSVIDEDSENAEIENNALQSCIKQCVWDRINESIDAVIDSITLQDLIDEYKGSESHPMFYI